MEWKHWKASTKKPLKFWKTRKQLVKIDQGGALVEVGADAGRANSGRTNNQAEERSENRTNNDQRRRRRSSSRPPVSSSGERDKRDQGETSRSEASGRSGRRTASSNRGSSSALLSKEGVADETDASLKEMTKRRDGTRGTSTRRASSTSSTQRDTAKDGSDESCKQTLVEERGYHRSRSSSSSSRSHRQSRRHSHSRSRRSSGHSSEWSSQSDSTSVQLSGSHDTDDTASDVSEEEIPGAYRVSSHYTSRVSSLASVASSSGPSFAVSEDDNTITASTRSLSTSYGSTSTSTMVAAEVARDMTEDISSAAREQGRAQALREASNRNSAVVLAVAQPRRPKANDETLKKRKRRRRFLFSAICCCIVISLMIIGGVGYFFLAREEDTGQLMDVGTSVPEDNSELNAVVTFDPPTAEDCASIANWKDVAGQSSMFIKNIDRHIKITTNSDEDAALLIGLLKEQVQLNLMPFIVGCDDLVCTLIGNGVVDSVRNETSICLFQNNPDCLEVVFTIKIYLRRKEDGSSVIEVVSDILLGEDLNESLELPPTIQTASVSLIVPSSFATEVPTETPSSNPTSTNTQSVTERPPSEALNTPTPSLKPTSWQLPTLLTSNPTFQATEDPKPSAIPGASPIPLPSFALDRQPAIETVRPTLVKTPNPTPKQQTPGPTTAPTKRPTPSPTTSPVPGSTPLPTFVTMPSPTRVPTPMPSQMASSFPTVKPSRTPTSTPSFSPSSKWGSIK